MSEQEAFGWAVRVVRLGDWSAAIPEQPKFEVADQLLTIHDICEREQNRDVPLPQAVADDLFALFDRASDADSTGRSKIDRDVLNRRKVFTGVSWSARSRIPRP